MNAIINVLHIFAVLLHTYEIGNVGKNTQMKGMNVARINENTSR